MSTHRSRTERDRQGARRIVVLGAALALTLMLALGFFLGQQAAYSGMGIDPESYRRMQVALPAVRQEFEVLSAELDVQRSRHEVDRAALEMVRREIAGQKEQIADLEEGLRFYRSLMAPAEISQGLSLRALELVALEGSRYAYRIVAQQEARKHQLLKGTLAARVFGMLGEEQVSYPLSELSDDVEDIAIVLRFRYFQAIEGEITLPPGFEPGGVSVVASASTPRKAEARAEFPWHVQERFTHVGK